MWRLPIVSSHALYYIAKTDSKNRNLRGDCTYRLRGKAMEADWWSLGLFDEQGNVQDNQAQRYAFNSSNVIRQSDGSFRITVSSGVQPGNWLPVRDDSDTVLLLRIFGPKKTEDAADRTNIETNLPKITRIACR